MGYHRTLIYIASNVPQIWCYEPAQQTTLEAEQNKKATLFLQAL